MGHSMGAHFIRWTLKMVIECGVKENEWGANRDCKGARSG